MRTTIGSTAALFLVLALAPPAPAQEPEATDWSMRATIIEACSCTMFCPCYFSTKPTAHHADHEMEHFCRFNNVFRVDRGAYGSTDLAGAKFWVAGDLGGDFTKGMKWAAVTFDPATTEAQRRGIREILRHLYPVTWESFDESPDRPIQWEASADEAVARLDDGKAGEVVLRRFQGMTDEPVVIRNLRYWGAPRNDGFVLMPNEVEAYRIGPEPFEYRGGNGFMITIEIASSDVGRGE